MSKILIPELSPSLGLSNVPKVSVFNHKNGNKGIDTTTRVHLKVYPWGEALIRSFPKPNVDQFDRQKPPSNNGERVQENGLSKRGKSTLRKGANYLQWRFKSTKMVTLTYGDTSQSSHQESKADLRRFLKSVQRYVTKHHPDQGFHYLWVAEAQKRASKIRGEQVVHYHLLTPYFLPKGKVNEWWNNSVNRPRERKGLPTEKLYPNIINAYHSGRYIGKYLQKEGHRIVGNGYAMAQATYQAIQPSFEGTFDVSDQQMADIEEHIFYNVSGRVNGAKEIGDKTDAVYWRWFSDAASYPIEELIIYHLKGNESIKFEALNGTDQEQSRATRSNQPQGSTGYYANDQR